jgi:acetyltransferase-like isoleucine patch superfamily enzyme
MNEPALSPQQKELSDPSRSNLERYREFAVGKNSWAYLAWYEFAMLIGSNLPGILGFGFRSAVYPSLFRAHGGKGAIGRGVTIRRPKQIKIGKGVLIDDYAVLDVRGDDGCIEIEDYASIGRFTTVVAKQGKIIIKSAANISSYCRLATQSKLEIGESVLVAAYAYLGPGNHQEGDEKEPLIKRAMEIKGGTTIGDHSWIGAHATVMDGVTVGERAVIGAYALVREDVPAGKKALGIPAKIK